MNRTTSREGIDTTGSSYSRVTDSCPQCVVGKHVHLCRCLPFHKKDNMNSLANNGTFPTKSTLVKNLAKNIQDLASFSGRFQDLQCKKNPFNS